MNKQIVKRWECKRGHITVKALKPDVCRECKKIHSDLWLSSFKEVK